MEEPWLRNLDKPRIESQIIPGLESLKVADLLIPFTLEWDTEFIEDTFCARDISEITSIPLMTHAPPDVRIWRYSKYGNYSVKSGYHLAMKAIYTGRGSISNGAWEKLWDLNMPPKVKNFAWQMVRNWLPTRINLQNKRLSVPATCVNCNAMLEQSWHLFYTCQFAQDCWEISPVKTEVNSTSHEIETYAEWFFNILENLDTERRRTFIMILWSIWHSRNERVWNNNSLSANRTITYAMDTLNEWLAVRTAEPQQNKQPRSRTEGTWRKPTAEFFKCNVGMVIRDSNGSFIICRTSLHQGTASVKEAEALAIHEALSWIKELGFVKVIVETDSKISADAIHSDLPDLTEFGLTITACRAITRNQSSYIVEHVRRQANRAAHALVKTALHQACFGISDVMPLSISSIIMDDCNPQVEVE